jgi:predicted membrane-bound mannosyltransferase
MMFQNSEENTFTVVPSKEEHRRSKYGAYFVMKVLLVVLCVLVVALSALVAKCFSSLKSLNERAKTLENGKSLKLEHGRGGSEQK